MHASRYPKAPITSFIGIIIAFLVSNNSVNGQQNGWSIKSPLETSRGFVSGTIMDEKIFLIGGFSQDHSAIPLVQVYNPVTDSWERKSDMPDIRHTFFAGAIRDTIYVAGGSYPDPENPSHALLPTEIYGYQVTAE